MIMENKIISVKNTFANITKFVLRIQKNKYHFLMI